MKKIIVLPGSVNSSFFVNEIPYLKKYFDDIYILSFSKQKTGEKILQEYKVKGDFCERVDFSLKNIRNLIRWCKNDYVKKEMRQIVGCSVQGLKKFLYLLLYGYYYVMIRDRIQEQIDCFEGDIYLYSFWLSRPAFCIANFYHTNSKIKKVFSRAHGYDLYLERNSSNYLPFRSFLEENLDDIFFVSEDGKRYFENRVSSKESLLHRACFRVARLGSYNENSGNKKVQDKERIVIASCSSIIEVKRLDLIIRVMEFLKGLNIYWIHIGKGNLENKIFEVANQQLADGQYCFLGEIKNSEILNTYKEYDVDFFINMSDSEGIPVSIMEALSVGIPVIARDVGGVAEIVNDQNGLLVSNIEERTELERIYAFVEKRREDVNGYKAKQEKAITTWKDLYNAEKNYTVFFEEMIV